jgi:hypothetical protein
MARLWQLGTRVFRGCFAIRNGPRGKHRRRLAKKRVCSTAVGIPPPPNSPLILVFGSPKKYDDQFFSHAPTIP